MKSYVATLNKRLFPFESPKKNSKVKRQSGRGSTGLQHLAKQIAVLVQLATLFANGGKPISKTPELEKQVHFLVSVLRGATTFSQQQIFDIKLLLANVSAHINATSAANPKEYYRFHLHKKEKASIDMSLPLQQLKTHWQMCMTCGELIFGLKAEHAMCSHEECADALLKKPVFGCTYKLSFNSLT